MRRRTTSLWPRFAVGISIAALVVGCSDGADPGAPNGTDAPATGDDTDAAAPAPADPPAAEADAGDAGPPPPGAAICDPTLAIFANGTRVDVASSDEMTAKVATTPGNNVWIVDTKACRTYFKVNKYVLRVESLYGPKEPGGLANGVEAATVVGTRATSTGPWTFGLDKRTRTLALVGTSTGQFRMGGFPHGLSLGTLAVGSTQTYGGAMSDAVLAETHTPDAKRAKALWDKVHPDAKWSADIVVVAHSAGSVPAEDVVVVNGGNAYLFGTPKYTDLSAQKTGKSSSGQLAYTIHIANHDGDPVSGSYRCSQAYYTCKQLLGRTGASDPDAASATCAVGKDPYCVVVLKKLDDSAAWANHDYSDMSVKDPG